MFSLIKNAAALSSILVVAAAPAFAQGDSVKPGHSAQIDVSQANLNSDRDWNKIADAIHEKSAEICERDTAASDRREADVEACTEESYRNGVQQMRDILARRTIVNQTRLARS